MNHKQENEDRKMCNLVQFRAFVISYAKLQEDLLLEKID